MNARLEPIVLYIDADACPVKAEAYKVAARHDIGVEVVANSPIAVPREPGIRRVVVESGPDVADDYIAERAGGGVGVPPPDGPGPPRCDRAGAEVPAPKGPPFPADSIGLALATRNLMEDLRSAGAVTGGPKPFAARDRSAFLSALDLAFVRLKRAGFRTGLTPD